MENPRLTFASPTVITGDRSPVSLIAHELAHSWSGNLVTSSSHRDLWLNEGFTTYVESRIVEALYGREQADMENLTSRHELRAEFNESNRRLQILDLAPGTVQVQVFAEGYTQRRDLLQCDGGREEVDCPDQADRKNQQQMANRHDVCVSGARVAHARHCEPRRGRTRGSPQ